jgi:hypothetical protein
MNPSADDVAIAVIAACRETGGDPLMIDSGDNMNTNRARHFALHALVHVFPKADRFKLCAWVGAVKPRAFWQQSWHQVAKPTQNGRAHMAVWFQDGPYDRVIRAIEADRTRRNIAPVAQPPPYRPPPGTIEKVLAEASPARPQDLGKVDHSGYRPPAGTIERVLREELEARPVFDRGGKFSERKPKDPPPKKKVDMQEELRRAIVNTAKLQGPL